MTDQQNNLAVDKHRFLHADYQKIWGAGLQQILHVDQYKLWDGEKQKDLLDNEKPSDGQLVKSSVHHVKSGGDPHTKSSVDQL